MSQQPIKPMEPKEAMTLATLAFDLLSENSDDPEWRHELARARLYFSQAINRPPAQPFFISPTQRRAGREAKY